MTLDEVTRRIVEASHRFTHRYEQPQAPPEPEPDPTEEALRGLFMDERAQLFLTWLDQQVVMAKLQRNTPGVRAAHTELLTAIGFESGLELVKAAVLNWRRPPETAA